jgi:Zn-dependent protease with chaperone function
LKSLLSLTFAFLTLTSAYGQCRLDNTLPGQLDGIIDYCLQKAQEKNLDYLPQYISEKNNRCQIMSNNSLEYQECQKELITFSSDVLQCETQLLRQNQMADYDEAQFEDIVTELGSVEIPNDLKTKIYSMAKVHNLEIGLAAYHSNVLNAHAGANNKILLSSGLWSKQSILTSDEVMAVIAHELSHIKENHSLKLGCLALEWSGSLTTLKDALSVFREDFSLESSRGQSYSKVSKSVEFRADELAVTLLYEAQYSPRLMGDALTKLTPKNEGGFSSGSHPDMALRIKKAYEYADIYTQSLDK